MLLKALESGYEEYRLFNGNMGSRLTKDMRNHLNLKLAEFWLPWLARWNLARAGSVGVESVIGGKFTVSASTWLDEIHFAGLPQSSHTAHNSANLNPVIAQFEASNPQASTILLRGSEIIRIPSARHHSSLPKVPTSPLLTEGDIIILTHHILDQLQTSGDQTPAIPPTASSPGNFSRGPLNGYDKPQNLARSMGSSKWSTYTLGMGSYLTNPSLPNVPRLPSIASLSLPAMSMPSVQMPSMPSIPSLSTSHFLETQKSESSSRSAWGLKNWTGLSKGSQRSSNRTPIAAALEVVAANGTTMSTQDNLTPMTPTKPPQQQDLLPPPDGSSVVEPEAMAEALSEDIEGPGIASAPLMEQDFASQLPSPEANKIFCCQTDSLEVEAQYHVLQVSRPLTTDRRYSTILLLFLQRGPLTLILIFFRDEVPDRLFGNANRLLEAVESIIENSDPSTLYVDSYRKRCACADSTRYRDSPYRHLVKTGALITSQVWPNRDQLWSGQSSDQQEVESVLFDAYREINR